jgi:hypothetical protein
LSRGEPGEWRGTPGCGHLPLGKTADLFRCRGKRSAQRGIERLPCRSYLCRLHAEGASAGQAVELRGVAEQCAVSPFAHIANDAANSGKHCIEGCAAAPLKGGKQFRGLHRTSSFGTNQLHLSLRG